MTGGSARFPALDSGLDRRLEAIRETRDALTETIDELAERLSPATLKQQVKSMMRSTDTSMGLGEALQSHPIPIALIGLGIGWLLIERSGAGERAGHAMGHQLSSARHWADRATYDTRARVQRAMEQASHAAEGIGERAGRAYGQIRDRASSVLPGGGDQGQDGNHGAGGHGTESYGTASYATGPYEGSGGRTMGQSAHKAQGSFWHLVDEYPLAAGLMGLALGAAIGAAIPSTSTEDEWMGQVGDEFRHRAADMGSDLAERGSHVAEAAASAARDAAADEAERQGLGGSDGAGSGQEGSGREGSGREGSEGSMTGSSGTTTTASGGATMGSASMPRRT